MRTWQQLKSKRLVRVLFGPVFRKSLGLSAVGLISLHSVQTLFLNHNKDYLSHRGSGQSTPLPPHVQDAIGQVFKDLMRTKRLTEADLQKIDMIISREASEPFHKGNLHALNGAFIGLPMSFSEVNKDSDINSNQRTGANNDVHNFTGFQHIKSGRKALHRHIPWTNSAIRYAIMRECLLVDSHDLQIRTTLQGVFLCLYSMVVQWNMTRFRQIFVFVVYSVVWSAVFGTALLQQWNYYKIQQDRSVEEEIASLGRDYITGGLEYYNCVVQRNIMSNDGQYDKNGNPRQRFFRRYFIPLTNKIEFFENKLRDFK